MKWRKIEPPDRRPGTINSKIHFLNGKTSGFFFISASTAWGKWLKWASLKT